MNFPLSAQTDSILEKIFSAQRDAYLIDYIDLSSDCDGAKEVLLSMNNKSDVELFKLYRPDCLIKNEHGDFSMKDFNSNAVFNHDKIEVSLNKMKIELSPFHWNSLKIHIKSNFRINDQLIIWGEKWIDADDEKEPDNVSGFNGVIHSVSIENADSENLTFFVDLGTSPTSALIELLNILELNGASRITFTNN